MAERELRRETLDFGSFERSKDLQLVMALVVENQTGLTRMVACQNREAVELTFELGQMVFYKRSENRLWVKGETSGNRLVVVKQVVNCDNNTIKYYVEPIGPTCHTGGESCFDLPEEE